VISTNLPNPYVNCQHQDWGNPFVEAFFVATGQKVTCADVFFSGHTVNMTLMGMVMTDYIQEPIQIACTWVVIFCGYYCIIATRYCVVGRVGVHG